MRLFSLGLIAFFSVGTLLGAIGLYAGAVNLGTDGKTFLIPAALALLAIAFLVGEVRNKDTHYRMGSKREIDAAIHRRGRA